MQTFSRAEKMDWHFLLELNSLVWRPSIFVARVLFKVVRCSESHLNKTSDNASLLGITKCTGKPPSIAISLDKTRKRQELHMWNIIYLRYMEFCESILNGVVEWILKVGVKFLPSFIVIHIFEDNMSCFSPASGISMDSSLLSSTDSTWTPVDSGGVQVESEWSLLNCYFRD